MSRNKILGRIEQLKVYSDKIEAHLYSGECYILTNPSRQQHMYQLLLQAKQADKYIEGSFDPESNAIISIEID